MPPLKAPAGPDIDLSVKVAFLSRPESYPERPARVEAKETHMSWVFLTDRHAYKLKKPVRYPFLDFSTLELRRRNCDAEIRLNRRLAPEIYVGVVSLGVAPSGGLVLGGGQPVDWLVKMRRLPAGQALDGLIRRNAVTQADIRVLGRRLAEFHRAAPSVRIAPARYRARLAHDVGLSEDALSREAHSLPEAPVRGTAVALRRYLERQAGAFDRRVREGRIVEGHGDLRPEHVYLGPEPVVADCLEFNRTLRTIDVADELSYLAMECAFEGAPAIGRWLFDAYAEAGGDRPAADLVAFYKCRRAFLRARISIQHLQEPSVREAEKWRARTLSYLDLAQGYALELA
jgi:aminoglycoside phosphotransferase family enzyme